MISRRVDQRRKADRDQNRDQSSAVRPPPSRGQDCNNIGGELGEEEFQQPNQKVTLRRKDSKSRSSSDRKQRFSLLSPSEIEFHRHGFSLSLCSVSIIYFDLQW